MNYVNYEEKMSRLEVDEILESYEHYLECSHNDNNIETSTIGIYSLERLSQADGLLQSAKSFDDIEKARDMVRGAHKIF